MEHSEAVQKPQSTHEKKRRKKNSQFESHIMDGVVRGVCVCVSLRVRTVNVDQHTNKYENNYKLSILPKETTT